MKYLVLAAVFFAGGVPSIPALRRGQHWPAKLPSVARYVRRRVSVSLAPQYV